VVGFVASVVKVQFFFFLLFCLYLEISLFQGIQKPSLHQKLLPLIFQLYCFGIQIMSSFVLLLDLKNP
jgi:hypothetical protein